MENQKIVNQTLIDSIQMEPEYLRFQSSINYLVQFEEHEVIQNFGISKIGNKEKEKSQAPFFMFRCWTAAITAEDRL